MTYEEELHVAIRYLQEGGETEALKILAMCTDIALFETRSRRRGLVWELRLHGPRAVYDASHGSDEWAQAFRKSVADAIRAACNSRRLVVFSPELDMPEPEATKEQVLNQGEKIEHANVHVWQNLRFASPPEVKIAETLERAGVLFLPNCATRLGPKGKRANRYPDFLICHNKKWGILEVDGATYHKPENKAQEDERNRLFHHHGIVVIQHYTAQRCMNDPDSVVNDFLELLEKLQ